MTGPVCDAQDQPFNRAAYEHQMRLLKSLHCGRQVVHQGVHQFIQCVTANRSGCDIEMIVHLAGVSAHIDSSDIQIKPSTAPQGEHT